MSKLDVMMSNRRQLYTLTALIISLANLYAQNNKNHRAIFIQAEYQCINYDYMTVGIGFQPKKHLIDLTRKHPKLSFIGYTINYSKKMQNSDWGVSLQTCVYSASTSGPIGMGLEANYKSIQLKDHFCLKPFIGLSFPIVSIVYAYNIDFYKLKSDRLNQNEIIVSVRIPIFTQRK